MTNFFPVLNAIYKDFIKTSGGLFGIGSTPTKLDYPVYIIFITDGENFDHEESREIIRKMSNAGFFIQFIGIGDENFRFLAELDSLSGTKIDNCNFFRCPNIQRTTDEELYKLLMKEFPIWLKKAEGLGLC